MAMDGRMDRLVLAIAMAHELNLGGQWAITVATLGNPSRSPT